MHQPLLYEFLFSERIRMVATKHCKITAGSSLGRSGRTNPSYCQLLIDELIPPARHMAERYANSPIEANHSRLKVWLRPM
jgi:hypothetical protein